MVNEEKVYLMTKAALFEKKESQNALRVVSYRRKDYILSRMLLTLLAVSVAYALLIAAAVFLVIMGSDTIVLNTPQMIMIGAIVVVIYIVILIFYFTVSHKYFGERHVRARKEVRKYLSVLRALEKVQQK
ncbi:MAG: hypothetical protein IKI54_02280 [Lachnospiraceae bacterium]|nr:hypothetical protein [Lachnospiraceae bacterium]